MNDPNPYASPTAAIEQVIEQGELRLGGRGERLGAVLLDGILHLACMLLLVVPLAIANWDRLVAWASAGQEPSIAFSIGMQLASFLLFVLVQAYPLWSTGQTWGKRMLKLRIVDLHGGKPEFWRLLGLRYALGWVLAMLPFAGLLYSLADGLFIFRDDRRCIHDLIAGTRVVVAD